MVILNDASSACFSERNSIQRAVHAWEAPSDSKDPRELPSHPACGQWALFPMVFWTFRLVTKLKSNPCLYIDNCFLNGRVSSGRLLFVSRTIFSAVYSIFASQVNYKCGWVSGVKTCLGGISSFVEKKKCSLLVALWVGFCCLGLIWGNRIGNCASRTPDWLQLVSLSPA